MYICMRFRGIAVQMAHEDDIKPIQIDQQNSLNLYNEPNPVRT